MLPSPAALSSADTDVPAAADRLRYAVTRLARLLRQQDEGGLGATSTAALSSVKNRGPMTLGELAACEQVAPPTMTKVVEKLESQGFVTRQVDPKDRRVTRVTVTPAGKRHLDATRARRTSWLAARLDQLDPDELQRLTDAIGTLEAVIQAEPR
ncbi:MAG: regulatory protein MarR [Ilumatobacteraceae bacterium]|nr:regulatory protein MarR [Ilumatobacteraceae bacterium]